MGRQPGGDWSDLGTLQRAPVILRRLPKAFSIRRVWTQNALIQANLAKVTSSGRRSK